jgi:formamidopyrimidine-DNA glycosylase
MPELPEVETIAVILRQGNDEQPPVTGRQVIDTQLLWERTLASPSPAEFKSRIIGQRIEDSARRGKYLLLPLSADTLIIHLRMSGDLLVEPATQPTAPHHRLMLNLDGGLRLAFNDTRKFGRVWLTSDPGKVLNSLGPEPLDPAFTAGDLYQRLQSRGRQLKPLLLDQSFLAGLGNIYTDEALNLARIHPLTIANTLTEEQTRRLWDAIRNVLTAGIRSNGASIDWVYRGGSYQHQFRVYNRAGEPCPECGTTIVRIVVGQRGTHLCPNCQPFPSLARGLNLQE